MSSLSDRVLTALREVVGGGTVALHEPQFGAYESQLLQECLDSTFVSSIGRFVDRFEAELAAFVGARHAVAVVNGTAALHVALRLAGVQPGDEVVVPGLTFVATAAAVTYCGATPHFADSEERTLGIDPRALRAHLRAISEMRGGYCVNRATARVIRAVVPVHIFGHPVDIDGILGLGHDYRLAIVEDASESLGSTLGGRHTGTFARLGTLSFNGNKIITTGGGGAILTDDKALASHAKHLTTTAKLPHRWEYRHDAVGYNYRMPNINAALGCGQLQQVPRFVAAKRRLFERYRAAFATVPGTRIIAEPDGCRSNYWLQTLLLDEACASERDAILEATNDAGLMTRPTWTLMHELNPYRGCPRSALPVAESLQRRLINLPSSPALAPV